MVELFVINAGDRYLTGSVHGLLHLPEAVRNLGPLWAHSCFGFESSNGDLLQLFHGSQAVQKQVHNVYTMRVLQEAMHNTAIALSAVLYIWQFRHV